MYTLNDLKIIGVLRSKVGMTRQISHTHMHALYDPHFRYGPVKMSNNNGIGKKVVHWANSNCYLYDGVCGSIKRNRECDEFISTCGGDGC